MKVIEKVSITDEILARFICQIYGVAHERGLSLNDPRHAAILLTGTMRFAAHLAQAHGLPSDALAAMAKDAAEHPAPITQYHDSKVRRWVTTFAELWGSNLPAGSPPSGFTH